MLLSDGLSPYCGMDNLKRLFFFQIFVEKVSFEHQFYVLFIGNGKWTNST